MRRRGEFKGVGGGGGGGHEASGRGRRRVEDLKVSNTSGAVCTEGFYNVNNIKK